METIFQFKVFLENYLLKYFYYTFDFLILDIDIFI